MNNDRVFQRDIFLEKEGDRYFERNHAVHDRADVVRETLIERIGHRLASRTTSRVLEIGCSSGGNLAALAQQRSIEGYGIDPSREAVEAGSKRFPGIDLRIGTADNLPFADSSLDLVWFGFCLYLVDRALLQRVVAEADRVLRDGGLLVVYDFDPDVATSREYCHHAGMRSFKMDYSRLFLANPAYMLVEKLGFTHDDLAWSDDPQERVGLWLLRKNVETAYRAV